MWRTFKEMNFKIRLQLITVELHRVSHCNGERTFSLHPQISATCSNRNDARINLHEPVTSKLSARSANHIQCG